MAYCQLIFGCDWVLRFSVFRANVPLHCAYTPERSQHAQPQIVTPEKSEARREAVYAASTGLAMDGIDTPPELEELGRQYVAGELNLVDYPYSCREFAKHIN